MISEGLVVILVMVLCLVAVVTSQNERGVLYFDVR